MFSWVLRGSLGAAILAGLLTPTAAASADDAPPTAAPDADVTELPGGAILRKAPGTRLSMERPIRIQLGPAGTPKTVSQSVSLTSGRIEIELPVRKVPSTAVLVRTPHGVSAIAKGGRSVILANPESTAVASYTGDMVIGYRDKWRGLRSGIVRDFRPEREPADHAVMTAPSLTVSAPIAFDLGEKQAAAVSAKLTPVANAKSYEFSIWRVGSAAPVLLQSASSAGPSLELPKLEPGNYAISAHGVEASGLAGPESELTPLRVVRAELPPGARLADGAILIEPRQRIRLHGTEDVEISYGRLSLFQPAPDSIGLYRGQPTMVRLRARGSTREFAFALEPRTIHAQIDFSPKRAHWPADDLIVAVRLRDAHGKPLQDDPSVKPVVTINNAKVPVSWRRTGDSLTAQVPPPSYRGPWIVRVELVDDAGRSIGRDFLEVAAEAPVAKRF